MLAAATFLEKREVGEGCRNGKSFLGRREDGGGFVTSIMKYAKEAMG